MPLSMRNSAVLLQHLHHHNLVGGIPTPLKNMKVSWADYSQYMESHKIPWFQTTNQIWMWDDAALSTSGPQE